MLMLIQNLFPLRIEPVQCYGQREISARRGAQGGRETVNSVGMEVELDWRYASFMDTGCGRYDHEGRHHGERQQGIEYFEQRGKCDIHIASGFLMIACEAQGAFQMHRRGVGMSVDVRRMHRAVKTQAQALGKQERRQQQKRYSADYTAIEGELEHSDDQHKPGLVGIASKAIGQ